MEPEKKMDVVRRVIKVLAEFSDKDYPWDEKVSLTQFSRTRDNKTYSRRHLQIRLKYKNQPIQKQMRSALLLHINHASPFIQNYYNLHDHSTQKDSLPEHFLQAETYRYTLREVIQFCAQNQLKLPKQAAGYIILCILQIYKFILYLFDTYSLTEYEGLKYCICPQNLAFNAQYRIILLNPCHSRYGNYNKPIRITDKSLKTQFRKDIVKTLNELREYIEKFQDHGLISYFSQDEQQKLKIEMEQTVLRVFYASYESTAMPKSLFRFLKEKMEGRLEGVLANQFKDQEEIYKQYLLQVIRNRLKN